MAPLTEHFGRAWNFLKGTPTQVVQSLQIPASKVSGSGPFPRLTANKLYFSVIVNEMFLTNSRQWFNVYDPMAIVVSEFTYDGKPTVVPFVVGPAMLEGKVQHAPNGIAITDTHVAGFHPYNGGRFALTMILAQVKRDSYAKRLLHLVESVSGAFAVGAGVEPYLKVSGTVLQGVEALFGMGDTVPIAGHRWEFDPGTTPWLEPGFFALINTDVDTIDRSALSVVNGRLHHEGESLVEAAAHKKRQNDYLLYSLCSNEKRTDLTGLPFYQLFQSALKEAASADEGGWPRAKAALVTLYQTMLTSPDLTWDQTQEVMDDFKTKVVAAHERAKGFSVLSTGGGTPPPDADARLRRLHEIHELLALP